MQAEGSERIGGPPRRRRPVLFALLAVGVIAALGWTVRSLMVSTDTRLPPVAVQIPGLKPVEPETSTPAAAVPPPAVPAPATGVVTPPALPADAPPLPALETSDPEVRASLTDVLPTTAHGVLAPAELLRRIAVMADSFGRGKVLRDRLPLPAPTGKMKVTERGDRIYLAPENFSRYNTLTDIVAAVDTDATVRWFSRYEPLLQQAWAELGNEGGNVRSALIAGLDLVLATPDLQGEIELVQPAVFYKYADPSVESLAEVQKLLLRVGPGNRAVIVSKARRMRDALANGG
jgi:Protein of unknown function (DUF3014)